MMRIKIILFLGLISANIFAQNVESDFEKIKSFFEKNDQFSFDVMVTVYKNKSDKNGQVIGSGKTSKSGGYYYSKYETDEMIVGDKGTLLLDHQGNEMVFFADKNVFNKNGLSPDFGDLMEKTDSVIFVDKTGSILHYVLFASKGLYSRTDVFFDAGSGFLSKIEYFHARTDPQFTVDAYKTVIKYNNLSMKPQNKSLFLIGKYISKTGKTWLPNKNYANWKLTIQN